MTGVAWPSEVIACRYITLVDSGEGERIGSTCPFHRREAMYPGLLGYRLCRLEGPGMYDVNSRRRWEYLQHRRALRPEPPGQSLHLDRWLEEHRQVSDEYMPSKAMYLLWPHRT